jgi:hypothetical protein
MSQVTINTISGQSPYVIYICDGFGLNCKQVYSGSTTVPPPITFDLPSELTHSPTVIVRIIDALGCQEDQSFSCITPTPTNTQTPTPSITPTITPSNTVTPSITPSYAAPTPTPTPSITSTITPTPSITPSTTPQPQQVALIIVEPFSAATGIGQYMNSVSSKFKGFTNGTSPSTSSTTFNIEMNHYLNFSGWSNNEMIWIGAGISPSSSGFDYAGNPRTLNNFYTVGPITQNSLGDKAWYTIMIPTAQTQGYIQKQIGISQGDPHSFTNVYPDSFIYSNTFTYSGYNFNRTTYRVYTTFPSTEFLLDNTQYPITFKGIWVGL